MNIVTANDIVRRKQILEGNLVFPPQIAEIISYKEIELYEDMFQNIWHNFLREKSCNTILWYEQCNNKDLFNIVLYHLSKSGWITSNLESNYAWLELNESKLLKWVTKEELIDIKRRYKFNKYRLKYEEATYTDKVKLNDKIAHTGIVREGFKHAGNNKFKYDIEYLNEYVYLIAKNLTNHLQASTKDINYDEIVIELLAYYTNTDNEYSLGNNISDSRGRAIYQCMKKVFNPISCKDARALLIVEPKEITKDGLSSVYAFIAELLGYKAIDGKYEDKITYGMNAYQNSIIPSMDEVEKDLDKLHIRIWLERIYANIKCIKEYDSGTWYVPIELDATASMIQIIGALTNNHQYLDKTNVIGATLGDIWTHERLSREQVKKSMQPILYGSSAEPNQLWDKNKIPYTQQELNIIQEALYTGIYAPAKEFKDFIISQVQPKETMTVKIWNEEFSVVCNKFRWEEQTHVTYPIYTSAQSLVKRCARTVNLTPDLEQFKRYFVTLLI